MLTRKQYELLMFIHDKLQDSGVSPSFEEMKEALDLKSKSGIHRLITGLEERGFLRRLPNRARALEVVRLPENSTPEQLPIRNRRVEMLRVAAETPFNCPCMAGSPPERRLRRCAIIPCWLMCPPPCWGAAITMRWRSRGIR